MDFRNLLGKLNQLNEGVEVVAEKAVSQAQQKAAGAALAAKRGDIPNSELTGASKEMLDMSEKDLEDFAGTKHKGIPKKKTDENYEDLNNIRKLSGLEEADEQDIMDKLQQMADGPEGEDELLMRMEMGVGEEGMFLRKLYDKVSNQMFSKDSGDLEDPEDFDKVHLEVMQMFGIEAEPLASLQQKTKDREISSALSDPELTGMEQRETASNEFDSSAFRKAFEAMVEAKSKPDFLDLDKDGDKKEPMKKAAKDAKGDDDNKSKDKGMTDKQKKYFGKKDESVEEGSLSRKEEGVAEDQLNELSFEEIKSFYVTYKVITEWGIPLVVMATIVAGLGIAAAVKLINQGKDAVIKKYREIKGTVDPDDVSDAAKKIKNVGNKNKDGVSEGKISRKFMKAMSFGPQTDSPKDMQAGIRKMSDKELLDLMRGDDVEAPSGSARSLQQKLLKREIKRRGIGGLGEGKSKHASMNESFEKFINNEKLSFEEAVKIVRESGGQQKIDPVDTALWNWAQRVAANKFTESRKAEMYAGLIYERNGGEFQLHDVLAESIVKKPEGISESVQSFTDAGIPKEYAEQFLKKYQVKHDAKISPTDGVPKASDIRRDSFIINVLPNGDVRGFGKKGDEWKVGKNFYSVLHMVDGKFTDTGYESLSAAKKGMSKQGKFYTLDGNMWDFYRDKKPDSARDTRGDVMTGDGAIYKYMNDTFMKNMRPMMEKMVDDIYANLRKLDNKNKTYYSPSDQERALEAAKTIEAIAEQGFNRSTMENFLAHLKRASYGFRSIPANERELRKILKDVPNARAKWAKTVLDAAKRQHERVKQMLYGPTVNALKGEPENA